MANGDLPITGPLAALCLLIALAVKLSRRVDDDVQAYRLATAFLVVGATLYYGAQVFAVEAADQPYLAGFAQVFTSSSNPIVALWIMWISLAGVAIVAGWLFVRLLASANRTMARRLSAQQARSTLRERCDDVGAFGQPSHNLCGCKVETCSRGWFIVRNGALWRFPVPVRRVRCAVLGGAGRFIPVLARGQREAHRARDRGASVPPRSDEDGDAARRIPSASATSRRPQAHRLATRRSSWSRSGSKRIAHSGRQIPRRRSKLGACLRVRRPEGDAVGRRDDFAHRW